MYAILLPSKELSGRCKYPPLEKLSEVEGRTCRAIHFYVPIDRSLKVMLEQDNRQGEDNIFISMRLHLISNVEIGWPDLLSKEGEDVNCWWCCWTADERHTVA